MVVEVVAVSVCLSTELGTRQFVDKNMLPRVIAVALRHDRVAQESACRTLFSVSASTCLDAAGRRSAHGHPFAQFCQKSFVKLEQCQHCAKLSPPWTQYVAHASRGLASHMRYVAESSTSCCRWFGEFGTERRVAGTSCRYGAGANAVSFDQP